eukprot:UN27944
MDPISGELEKLESWHNEDGVSWSYGTLLGNTEPTVGYCMVKNMKNSVGITVDVPKPKPRFTSKKDWYKPNPTLQYRYPVENDVMNPTKFHQWFEDKGWYSKEMTTDMYTDLHKWTEDYHETEQIGTNHDFDFQFVYLSQTSVMSKLTKIVDWPYHITITYVANQEKSIYFPNSSWNSGRNLLYFMILKFEESTGVSFRYYMMLDGDTTNKRGDFHYGWHSQVLQYLPAMASASFTHVKLAPVITWDALFQAFHRCSLKYMLPYATHWDDQTWWASQYLIWWKAFLYFRDSILLSNFQVGNEEHSEYPQGLEFQ